jgi:hypothetical protein
MGWDYGRKPRGATPQSIITERLQSTPDHKVLSIHQTHEAMYIALEYDHEGAREVCALVVLYTDAPSEFGCKIMGEEMHPYYYGAPLSFLDLLTPATQFGAGASGALTWRHNCHLRAARKERAA